MEMPSGVPRGRWLPAPRRVATLHLCCPGISSADAGTETEAPAGQEQRAPFQETGK